MSLTAGAVSGILHEAARAPVRDRDAFLRTPAPATRHCARGRGAARADSVARRRPEPPAAAPTPSPTGAIGAYELRRCSAPAAWARCIARATRGSAATSRSRCCRARFTTDPERLARFEREARAAGGAQSSAHRRDLRRRGGRRRRRPRAGAGRGRDAGRAARARAAAARRGARDRPPDRRRARGRARAGHHPPRSEAREHQDHARRAWSRCSTSGWRRSAPPVADGGAARRATRDASAARAGRHPRHGRLHEPGAGARASRSTSGPTSGPSAACSTRC